VWETSWGKMPDNAAERTGGQRGRAVLAMDCALGGAEWAPCQERPSSKQAERQAAVVSEVTRWAEARGGVQALGLVGSWARGQARADSDIDLIVLAAKPERYRESAWLDELDWSRVGAKPATWTDETYGAVWSRRVLLDDGTEVEFSFGSPSWAAVDPFDAGTRRVLSGGCRVLHDPEGLLHGALRRIYSRIRR
jgi:nucleotidyltransferase-like protein